MKIKDFVRVIEQFNVGFYTGVPDSQLAPFCNYLMDTYGISDRHMVAANEGNSVALAAGYHLATGKIPVVYLQNSGIGNTINPVVSLLHDRVYEIPCIFIIGWRGEPGMKDEPQHSFQGEITLQLLNDINIDSYIITKEMTIEDLKKQSLCISQSLSGGKSIAFVIKKDAFTYQKNIVYNNEYKMKRETVIERIVNRTQDDIVISTTGKISRELFEIRENKHQQHNTDFLTVGSMGHCSSIALSIALAKPNKRVWCIDGDGAALMHMGAMATIGSYSPHNLIHIVINNEAHETVGGMPNVANHINFVDIALGCGYPKAISVDNYDGLEEALFKALSSNELILIEVKVALGSRKDLGRPTTTAKENKNIFMKYLKEVN